MVRWLRWHSPPDTGFETRTLAVWGRARYISTIWKNSTWAKQTFQIVTISGTKIGEYELPYIYLWWKVAWGWYLNMDVDYIWFTVYVLNKLFENHHQIITQPSCSISPVTYIFKTLLKSISHFHIPTYIIQGLTNSNFVLQRFISVQKWLWMKHCL